MRIINILFVFLFFQVANAQENKIVSVVIPAYNVEQYIEQAVNSVINQTYKNLEIIIVEDVSTDNTYEVLKTIKDDRIRLYRNDKNSGVSATRNRGIEKATGYYLYFIDSDDWIDLNYIEKMVNAINESGADFVLNKNINNVFDCDELEKNKNFRLSSPTIPAGMISIKNNHQMTPAVWDKLFKLSIIRDNDLHFPETLRTSEDIYFLNVYAANSNSLFVIDGPKYNYRIRKGTLLNRGAEKMRERIFDGYIKSMKMVFEYFGENPKENTRFIKLSHALCCIYEVGNNAEKFYSEIRNILLENKYIIENNKENYDSNELMLFRIMLKNEDYDSFIGQIRYNKLKMKISIFTIIFLMVSLIAIALRSFYLFIKEYRVKYEK